ncbi:MAG: tetratricopeptide repeat protein [Spirochaetales bacterium]|nr:tetratricopeptide repeat protein [Spirochaetales bacterium]
MYELNNKGVMFSKEGKLDEAINLFNAALVEDPNDPNVNYNMALVYMKKEDFKKAIEYLEKSVESQPCDDNLREIAVCYIRLKDFKTARKYLIQAVTDFGSSDTENVLGVLFFQMAHFEEAMRHFEHATKLNELNKDAWFNLSDTLDQLGLEKESKEGS